MDAIVKKKSILWSPSKALLNCSNMALFMHKIEQQFDQNFKNDYENFYHWSCQHHTTFWEQCYINSGIYSLTPYQNVMAGTMPEVKWFTGTQINYVHEVFKQNPSATALYCYSEIRPAYQVSFKQLTDKVKSLANYLRSLGVTKGDRVVSYLPNIEETTIAMLATASLGAIWSSAAPEFGVQNVLDRFSQIEPKVIFICDGYKFSGKTFSKVQDNQKIIQSLSSLEKVIYVDYLTTTEASSLDLYISFDHILATTPAENFEIEYVTPEDPLWILFSSGTTGLPKAIVHSHLGMLLESWLSCYLHLNIQPESKVFFYTTTGWMMWNFIHGVLTLGASAVLYDGSPTHPDKDHLWKMVEEIGLDVFGASPTYIQLLQRENFVPKERYNLSHLQTIIVSGSPLMEESFHWIYENVKDDVLLAPLSGGTDICGAFIGPTVLKPVIAGEMQCRMLGKDIQSWDASLTPQSDQIGELVCTQSLPCMPLMFWNDADHQQYKNAYFEDYPGIWKHGDLLLITKQGGCVIKGRSDATLNRYGVRIGTAEIYRVVEKIENVVDSLIVCCEYEDGHFYMPMFIQMKDGYQLRTEDIQNISTALRQQCSPRHIPDAYFQVTEIPYTLTGKKMEVPVRKIIMGGTPQQSFSIDTMKNPNAMNYFLEFRPPA